MRDRAGGDGLTSRHAAAAHRPGPDGVWRGPRASSPYVPPGLRVSASLRPLSIKILLNVWDPKAACGARDHANGGNTAGQRLPSVPLPCRGRAVARQIGTQTLRGVGSFKPALSQL